MNSNEPKDIKLTTKLRMKDGLTFTAMCPACYTLFNITIPKVKIDFEYTTPAQDATTTETLSINNSSLVDRAAYCKLLQLKHNCMRAYLQLSQDGCGPFLVQIDDRIAEAVSLFNKCGFYTSLCSQGCVFCDGSYALSFIMFKIKKRDRNSKKYLNMLQNAILKYHGIDYNEYSYDEALSCGLISERVEFDRAARDENLVLSIYHWPEDRDKYSDMEFEEFCYHAAGIARIVTSMQKEEKKEGD